MAQMDLANPHDGQQRMNAKYQGSHVPFVADQARLFKN
jgi:hypothetical protein